MEAPRLERRLVAILAADVEGYSRHMERDEAETLATLSDLRLIFDTLIADHKGRIANTAGDSVLAEFQSVVDALDCAVKVQQEMTLASESLEEGKRLRFRIGLNVGDVMVKDGDIFGDGVNIAARLETLALPGGICVSRGVRDHVRKMSRYAFEDLGEQSVKNIAQPIRAFRLRNGKEEWVEPPMSGLAPTVTAAPEPSTSGTAAFELTFWDAIKESKDPAEFTAYLEQYPEGSFTALAEARRNALLEESATPAEPLAPAATDSDLAGIELAFWDSVKESEDPAEFTAYLEKYPAGAFTALAEARRQALIEAEAAPPPSAAEVEPVSVELAFWDTVKESDNPAMYAAYLEQYPEGSFAALAKVRLEELPPAA